jgi:hypothetical protein
VTAVCELRFVDIRVEAYFVSYEMDRRSDI